MSSLTSFILLTFNLLTFVLTFSVLMLAVWQSPGSPIGRALNTFLSSLVLLNIAVIGMLVSELSPEIAPMIRVFMSHLALLAFALNILTAFGLVITAAGLTKQALHVIRRAGWMGLLLLQWPLWMGQLFDPTSSAQTMLEHYAPAGQLAAVTGIVYILLALWVGVRNRRRIGQPALLISLSILFVGQLLALLFAPLRALFLPSLLTSLVSGILGYSLVRLQLFNPLSMRTAQLAAVRDLSQAVTNHQDLQQVLNTVVEQAQALLNTGAAVLSLADNGGLLIAAQSGNIPQVTGSRLAAGEGLAGRVLQTQQPMGLANYRGWDGRAKVFADMPLYASMSVPLLDGEETLGVLTVHELESGRMYSERDRAVIEMLVSQATLGIVHARMHGEIGRWRAQANNSQHPALSNALGMILEHFLQGDSLRHHGLLLALSPDLPPLPLPVATVEKMVVDALEQVIDMATDGQTVQIGVYADGPAVLIDIRAAAPDSVMSFSDFGAESVRIRLEKK